MSLASSEVPLSPVSMEVLRPSYDVTETRGALTINVVSNGEDGVMWRSTAVFWVVMLGRWALTVICIQRASSPYKLRAPV